MAANGRSGTFTARKIAYCAVMTALLTGAQVALGFVSGVEIVTLLLACFSACAGIISGVITAVCFCLLRCFIWGFYPNVIVLYLVYFPAFALIFGLLGHIRDDLFSRAHIAIFIAVNVLLLAVACTALCCCILKLIKISRLYADTVYAMMWAIFALSAALDAAFNALFLSVRLKRCSGAALRIFMYTSVACVCTICFTLLDDVISPLMLGMTEKTALAYFYASFMAMLPQTICTLVTLSTLSAPVTYIMRRCLRQNY